MRAVCIPSTAEKAPRETVAVPTAATNQGDMPDRGACSGTEGEGVVLGKASSSATAAPAGAAGGGGAAGAAGAVVGAGPSVTLTTAPAATTIVRSRIVPSTAIAEIVCSPGAR